MRLPYWYQWQLTVTLIARATKTLMKTDIDDDDDHHHDAGDGDDDDDGEDGEEEDEDDGDDVDHVDDDDDNDCAQDAGAADGDLKGKSQPT